MYVVHATSIMHLPLLTIVLTYTCTATFHLDRPGARKTKARSRARSALASPSATSHEVGVADDDVTDAHLPEPPTLSDCTNDAALLLDRGAPARVRTQ